MATTDNKKQAIWLSVEAHERLQRYCEINQRTQVEVLTELIDTVITPKIEEAGLELIAKKGK